MPYRNTPVKRAKCGHLRRRRIALNENGIGTMLNQRRIDHREGVAAEQVHVAEAFRDAPIRHHDRHLVQRFGQKKVDHSVRYYVSPNVNHGSAGKSATTGMRLPQTVDLLTVLEAWVENGKAPPDALVTPVVTVAVKTVSTARLTPGTKVAIRLVAS